MEPQFLWRFAFIYFAKADPRSFLLKRTGLGWTLDFGHPASRLLLGAVALVVAAAAAIGGYAAHVR